MPEYEKLLYVALPAICLTLVACGSDNELKNYFREAQTVISNITTRMNACHTPKQCEQLETELRKHAIPMLKNIQRSMYQQAFHNIQHKHGKLSESERIELLSTMAHDARNSCEFATKYSEYRSARKSLESRVPAEQIILLLRAMNEFESELEKFSPQAILSEYRK